MSYRDTNVGEIRIGDVYTTEPGYEQERQYDDCGCAYPCQFPNGMCLVIPLTGTSDPTPTDTSKDEE